MGVLQYFDQFYEDKPVNQIFTQLTYREFLND